MSLWGNRDSKVAYGTIASISEYDDYGVVLGSGTYFNTMARVGNYIITQGNEYLITEIRSYNNCKVVMGVHGEPIQTLSSGTYNYTFSEKPAYVADAEAHNSSGSIGDSSRVYGVDIGEMTAGGDNIVAISVATKGHKYRENQVVFALSDTNAVGETIVNQETGEVESVLMLATGTLFSTVPNVYTLGAHYTIESGNVESFAPNTIRYVGHPLETGDYVRYLRMNGTCITGSTVTPNVTYSGNALTNTLWYVRKINADNFALYNTLAGALGTGATPENHVLVINGHGNNNQRIMLANDGDLHNTADDNKATFVAILGSGDSYDHSRKGATITHAGWVRRTIGTGGRAGRVQYETLVAMSSISGDQADDLVLPDAP